MGTKMGIEYSLVELTFEVSVVILLNWLSSSTAQPKGLRKPGALAGRTETFWLGFSSISMAEGNVIAPFVVTLVSTLKPVFTASPLNLV